MQDRQCAARISRAIGTKGRTAVLRSRRLRDLLYCGRARRAHRAHLAWGTRSRFVAEPVSLLYIPLNLIQGLPFVPGCPDGADHSAHEQESRQYPGELREAGFREHWDEEAPESQAD